ncbi:MAG: hypothetical protein ACRCX2_00860 [Paraclostridium sp.]
MLDKLNFNQMLIEEQINYFNKELHGGKKLNEICDELGISYNTVRERFKRNNFTFNRYLKQYECVEATHMFDNALIEKALEELAIRVFNTTEDKIQTTSDLVCNISGNVVNRSFRVYQSVLDDFTKFCENSKFNQYDILSKFIKDGIEKYGVK